MFSLVDLPIVERELRVRARWRSLPWIRLAIVVVATLVAVLVLAIGGSRSATPGNTLLLILAWMAFVFCLVEGLRQTSDSMSQEIRDGTVGLLFLTDLSGLQIILGKLFATSLTSFYGLMAAFPVMAIALLAGGATFGEFGRIQLVLLNTLFVTSAIGLWQSTRTEDDTRAFLRATAYLLGLTLLPLLARASSLSWFAMCSPMATMLLAEDARFRVEPEAFWISLAVIHGLGWVLLWRAGRNVTSVWRLDPLESRYRFAKPGDPETGLNYRITPSLRARARRSVSREDPLRWLAGRQSGLAWPLWLGTLMPVLPRLGMLMLIGWLGGAGVSIGGSGIHLLGSLLQVALLVTASARGLMEARRSGALELVMTTPVSVSQIVHSYWAAIWAHLRRALLALLAVWFVVLSIEWSQAPLAAQRSGLGAGYFVYQVMGYLSSIILPVAACWLGMWLALRCQSRAGAVGRAFVWLTLIPMILSWSGSLVISLLLMRLTVGGLTPLFWMAQCLNVVLGVTYLVMVIIWARRRLLTRFREAAIRSGE